MKFLSLVILFYSSFALSAQSACNHFFEEVTVETEVQDSTISLIAYLTRLLEENKIGEKELQRLVNGEAPITEEEAREKIELKIYREDIKAFLSQPGMTLTSLLSWATNYLKQTQQNKVQRDQVQEDTDDYYHKMEFHKVQAGSFLNSDEKIDHDYEMMSTPVTQRHWFDVMGSNPVEPHYLNSDDHYILKNSLGQSVEMNQDYPVFNLTLWSAFVFANRLSELHGYDPAYDLSGIRFSGRAENGSLKPLDGQHMALGQLFRNSNGYRLPTEAEWSFVATNHGRLQDVDDYIGNNEQDAMVHIGREGGYGFPVTGKLPLLVEGKAFYSLVGNMAEMTEDFYTKDGNKKRNHKCTDAIDVPVMNLTVGRSFRHYRSYKLRGHHCGIIVQHSHSGFRLLRTLP